MASLNTLAVKLTAICGVCSAVLFFTNTDVAEIKHTQRKKGPQIAATIGLIADRCVTTTTNTHSSSSAQRQRRYLMPCHRRTNKRLRFIFVTVQYCNNRVSRQISTNLQGTCFVQPPITAGAAVDAAAASAIAVYVEAPAPGSSGKRPFCARPFSENRRRLMWSSVFGIQKPHRIRVFSEKRRHMARFRCFCFSKNIPTRGCY